MSTPSVTAVSTRRTLGLAVTTAVITIGLAFAGSRLLDVPMHDPDGFLGPTWVRMPAIVALCLAIDVLPRTLWRARGLRGAVPVVRQVWAERWPLGRLVPVVTAVLSFYVTYVGYRNLKNLLPFVPLPVDDWTLVDLDHVMTFGHNPADLLHSLLGTGAAAYVLSDVYMALMVFVPISVVVSLIWWKRLSHSLWYVTALCLNWALGVVSYYLVPSSGPFWALPWDFESLPKVAAVQLQQSLLHNRAKVLADPHATASVSGIAAFASLHVSLIFTAAMIVHLTSPRRLFRVAMWVYFALTATATIYFGYHYLVDDIAGLAIGAVSVWAGAWATGQLRSSVPAEVGLEAVDVAAGAEVDAQSRREDEALAAR